MAVFHLDEIGFAYVDKRGGLVDVLSGEFKGFVKRIKGIVELGPCKFYVANRIVDPRIVRNSLKRFSQNLFRLFVFAKPFERLCIPFKKSRDEILGKLHAVLPEQLNALAEITLCLGKSEVGQRFLARYYRIDQRLTGITGLFKVCNHVLNHIPSAGKILVFKILGYRIVDDMTFVGLYRVDDPIPDQLVYKFVIVAVIDPTPDDVFRNCVFQQLEQNIIVEVLECRSDEVKVKCVIECSRRLEDSEGRGIL